jgi:hypothetical protein
MYAYIVYDTMKENMDVSSKETLSPKQLIQIKIVECVFSTFTLTTKQQEGISGLSHHTYFIRAVRALVPMLWGYMPDQIKEKITKLYETLDKELKEMQNTNLNLMTWDKKKDAMRITEDKIATEVFSLLIITLTKSPIAQSSEVFDVSSDEGELPDLIQSTRSDKMVELFES